MKSLVLIFALTATISSFAESEHNQKYLSYLVSEELYYPGTDIHFSISSDANGVCKLLGYSAGVAGSGQYDEAYTQKNVIQVNASGEIVSGASTYLMDKIICLGGSEDTAVQAKKIVRLEHPVHQNSGFPISYDSNYDGVCKQFGHYSSVRDSPAYGDKVLSLQINSDGNLYAQQKNYTIANLFCISDYSDLD